MDNHAGPQDDTYDAIVIGAGLGGVSAGAFLAKGGKKTLVIERLDGPGGYARAFQRGPYSFDPAIHWTVFAGENQILDVLLRTLGVRDLVTMLRVDPAYASRFPDYADHTPAGAEPFIEHYSAQFPQQANQIHDFIRTVRTVVLESQQLPPQVSFTELDRAVQQFPTLFRYRSSTLAEVLDEFFTDDQLKALLGATWPYPGTPPSRLSFFTWCSMTMTLLENAIFYCQGSFQRLADAYIVALQRNGGELVLNTEVSRILTREGKVYGVVLMDGREITAPVVVSNADARQTFERLIGIEHLPTPFTRRLQRMQPSLSACTLFAATDLDLRQKGAAHETFLYKHWDHQNTYQDILDGRPGGLWANVPTLLDPSLAPEGEHIIIFTSLAQYDVGTPWSEKRDEFQNAMLKDLETLFPGVTSHLTYREFATPQTLNRFTLNSHGACYGWENTPQQAGSRRLNPVTPIENLFLAGHWTQPGFGSFRSMFSGMIAAQIVLQQQLLPTAGSIPA